MAACCSSLLPCTRIFSRLREICPGSMRTFSSCWRAAILTDSASLFSTFGIANFAFSSSRTTRAFNASARTESLLSRVSTNSTCPVLSCTPSLDNVPNVCTRISSIGSFNNSGIEAATFIRTSAGSRWMTPRYLPSTRSTTDGLIQVPKAISASIRISVSCLESIEKSISSCID